ncbi:uncharacterized protein Z519_08407 [Cladophialophora bantiana CBS 173.52]|uniref:Uncharacterized protein n=1 Tax=Cladophialophora bantiana (strain ATCC 10958 / CBS 173.52 / CDC B-1940 / NIH 8579) TaxID=1442370 RepID=A0A0D2I172_CLAB1|nr:uncharacterized protein Z519_08407 [Cladophialophora bantiana CBS 173.52]KIW90624.1 hypothetical protein Z519_08407 [Cladophialophora bantiana CBS 173.52]
MSSSKDYTVGWVCAIASEYVAAQAFSDRRHDGLEYVSPYSNNEHLGKIGKHNVVITVLSKAIGIDGSASKQNHDINLGDIVVGSPRATAAAEPPPSVFSWLPIIAASGPSNL